MANVSWANTNNGGNWNLANQWSGLPVGETYPGQTTADNVTLGTSNKTYTVTFNVASPSVANIASLTITGGASGTTTLKMTAGDTLTDSGGITLSNTNSRILGAGTISVGGIIGSSGTITAGVQGTSGGTLALTGAGSIASGVALAIGTTGATTLQLDLAGGVTAAAPITINSSSQTLKISKGNLTIGAAQNVTSGAITMAGGTITDASGISFGTTTSNGTLSGFGTVAANLTRSGTGAADTITASGGTLDLTGTFGTGLVAAIANVAGSDLKFDNTGTSAAAISITSANQTLEVGASGALTIGAAQNVTLGTIKLGGGTLTDASGISFGTGASNGTLSGFGTVAADLTRVGTGTANTITASGGTLDLTGTFGAGLVAAIDTAAASTLKFDSTSTVSALSITNANQTLEIHSGTLTLIGVQTVSLGKILMSGGTLADASGIVLGSGASPGTLIGAGTVTAAVTNSGSGNAVLASGGTLALSASIGAVSGLSYTIANSAASVLELDGTVGAGNAFTFLGNSGHLLENNVAALTTEIVGLDVGTSAVTPTNFIDFKNQSLTISGSNLHSGTSGTITLSDGSVLTLTGVTGNTGGNWFADAASDGAGGTNIFVSTVVCFAAGTRILTATGERMVESLLHGDIVLTLAGGELSAQPVKWIGRRRLDLTAHPRPETVAPVRIRRGAFAEAMPHTDLLVSPDHAVFVDGRLICARQLINGTTIRQETGWTAVEYFHVELDAHAILLAEGLPAESYLNTGNHGFFANADAPVVLHPDLTDETDHPTREAGSCAPFVWDEGSVRPVWQRLADRAEALGQPAPKPATITDPGLRIVAKGRTVRPLYGENGLYIFALPKGATEVRLVSRAGAPTDVRPWLEDRRTLGVYVERILLRSAREMREVPLDHPGLAQGWWAVEQGGGIGLRRWTGGDALLPLPAVDGPTMLEIRASNAGMAYMTGTEQASRVA